MLRKNLQQYQKQEEPKKIFTGKFTQNARILFSISSKGNKLGEPPGDLKDPDFAAAVKLICQTSEIKEVVLNITFNLMRWNIVADLLYYIRKVILQEQEDGNNIIPDILSKSKIQALKDLLETQFNDQNLVEILIEATPDLYKELREFEKKPRKKNTGIQLTEIPLLKKLVDECSKYADQIIKKWETSNKKATKTLNSCKVIEHFYWNSFLEDKNFIKYSKDISELYKNKDKDKDKDQPFRSQVNKNVGKKIQSRYGKINGKTTGWLRKYIELCLKEYAHEESAFSAWASRNKKINCTYEIHDGKIYPEMSTARNELGDSDKLKFIEITNKKNQLSLQGCSYSNNFFVNSSYPPKNDPKNDYNQNITIDFSLSNGIWNADSTIIFKKGGWDKNAFCFLQKKIQNDLENIKIGKKFNSSGRYEDSAYKIDYQIKIAKINNTKKIRKTVAAISKRLSNELNSYQQIQEKKQKNPRKLPFFNSSQKKPSNGHNPDVKNLK